MPDADIEVAVVGGGISGLSAAYELHGRGIPFTLFERARRLGGVIRTDHVDGFTIDGGPDSLLVQKPAAIALCHELGLGDRLVSTLPPRTAFVLRDGRLHPLPEASILGIPTRLWPLAKTSLLSAAGKLQMALELTRPPRTAGDEDDESVASFFGRRFGKEAVDYIAEPLLAGIHAGDVTRLSMRALFPRLTDAERRAGSVIRAFRSLRTRPDPDGLFRSLPGGLGELLAALVDRLPSDAIRSGVGVSRLQGNGPHRIDLTTGESVTARHVVMAVPAYVTAELIRELDPELATLCDSIPYTSTATVALGYPRTAVRHELRGTGFVVPRIEGSWSLMAGSWVTSKWPQRAPDELVLLRGFLGGARDPSALDRTDAGIVADAHRDFSTLFGISNEPVVKRVYRWPRLSPQHEVGHLGLVKEIDTRLERLPQLQLIGAGLRAVGLPDCVAHGRAAGERASHRS